MFRLSRHQRMSGGLSRRRLLQTGATMAAVSAGVVPALPASAGRPPIPLNLAAATRLAAPRIRWWLPLAATDPAELVRELDAIAGAGFGGVEVAAMATAGVDPSVYGWGSDAWADRMTTVLEAAKARNLTVDLTIGPQWPAGSSDIDVDSPAAAQELVYGYVRVSGGDTVDGPVPVPGSFDTSGPFGGNREPGTPSLVAVTAARLVDSAATAKPVLLDPSSVVDLTSHVRAGSVRWTAPAQGEWLLFAFWRRGTGQKVSGATETSYVVDHYSLTGSRAVFSYWDTHFLTPAIRRLVAQAGADLFEDSIQLQFVLPWTPDLLAEFRRRRGYVLTAYLPVLFIQRLHVFGGQAGALSPESAADYDFPGDAGYRIRNDLYQVLTELYQERHLDPIRAWAHSLGLGYRCQPSYGSVLEMASAATHVDVPETEQLYFVDSVDAYRAMAGGVHLSGKRLYSVEAAPVLDVALQDAYGGTWQRMLDVLNLSYAGGVNLAVMHGFAYPDAPGAQWPGWAPFAPFFGQPGFGEAWDPRQPSWRHMPDVNGYLARQQHVLRAGQPQVDLAVYRQSYWDNGQTRLFTDPAVARAGYSYEAVSPALLADGITAKAGVLAPDGPAYQAVVVPAGARLDVEAAKALLGAAKRGVPVILVGALPVRAPFRSGGTDPDAELRQIVSRLSALPSVRQVDAEADVVGALAALRVAPRVRPAAPVDIWSVVRADRDTSYFWLYNPGPAPVSTEVSLIGTGRPYLIDVWTGRITPVPQYRQDRGRTVLTVDLSPSATAIYALTDRGGSDLGPGPVVSSTAEVVWTEDGAAVRAPAPGTYRATYQDGGSRTVRITEVPAAQTLTGWHLSVDDWRPGAGASETDVVTHELDLPELLPWPQIPRLRDVSGIGRYTTSFTLPRSWTGGRGAYLDLGAFFNTVRVTVNGRRLPPVDLHRPVLDLKGFLRAGRNTIEVEVTTTLRNRLRTLPASGQAGTAPQDYGLHGPVTVTPYGEQLL